MMHDHSPIGRLKELARPTGEEDLMPVSYPDAPRLHLTLRQAAAIVAVVLALAAVFVVRDARHPPEQLAQSAAVAAPSPGSAATPGFLTQPGAAPSGAPSSVAIGREDPTGIVVSVVGHVEHLGLVTLPQGARVNDAIEHAKPLPDAQISALNLAQVLSDGEQILVPGPGEELAPAGSTPVERGKVSLNRANTTELTQLPGVGATTAAAIVKYRESIGGFSSVEQLMEVKGIGPAKFEALRDEVQL